MPTYDYVCDACGHKFEHFQSIKEDALKKCPACKKNKLRRLIGAGAAIVFKGSGFYQTDYRSESYKKRAASDAPSSTSESSKAEGGKTESAKSEPKAESSGTKKEKHKPKSKSSD